MTRRGRTLAPDCEISQCSAIVRGAGALANYSSTKSAYPGTGPYEGYENEGPVTGGNLVAHKK